MSLELPDGIFKLEGLPFIKELLKVEKERFDSAFLKESVFEQINIDFGIFPSEKVYPVYFSGDVTNPYGKKIFIGINPGYKPENNRKETDFLEKEGIFEGYCRIFDRYFKENHNNLTRYFLNIRSFLNRLDPDNIQETIDWDWLQENCIFLNFIPYHSKNTGGLRINDLEKFRRRYFKILLKILNYIRPEKPVFINGFPTVKSYLNGLIKSQQKDGFWVGKVDSEENKFDFIGTPFLNRVRGGMDALTVAIRQYLQSNFQEEKT